MADTLNITAVSSSFDLVKAGTLTRLHPGQSAIVQIGVKNKAGVAAGTSCSGVVTATWGTAYGPPITSTETVSGSCGFGDYTADANSLSLHRSPDWFNEAKFGIFIHWGLYSAPAYGSVAPNEDYAEWYWKRMNDPTFKTQTYQYHNATYGKNFTYDDFISNFTATNFNAESWVNLIAAAGAQYMVPVTRPPTNPYTGAVETYTGFVNVSDFIQDIQLPQQNVLAYNYDTEIMWCDIAGSANNATIFASKWINWARDQGRQVTFNSRCGIAGDFDTPEYRTNGGTVPRKWETNRGMDPFSFGYNYRTPDSRYLTGKDIVQTLVDTVSKNGNFLLDIGPKNDGSIPAIMQQGLQDAGKWIHAHAESIFKTRYWSVTPGLNNWRYTTTQNAFYIHYLTTPSGTITTPDIIPYLPGDTVTILGGSMDGTAVPVTWNSDGTLSLSVSSALQASDKFVWTFKLAYTSTW
ncbi:Plasma alpha-L-fucosidase [Penicillium subrubescens]|uniref:alpha-L-fucosidase n=1 Tax=Penicillium subrubescens TaxID=1316194 RepID=A0A1Q5TXM9_9EURO|nr:Plasma alpha-L-fucosidase [Penicillium subrubescens]